MSAPAPRYESLLERLTELRKAAKAECPPCVGSCLVQPCGPHCDYPYTDKCPPACEICERRHEANAALAKALLP